MNVEENIEKKLKQLNNGTLKVTTNKFQFMVWDDGMKIVTLYKNNVGEWTR